LLIYEKRDNIKLQFQWRRYLKPKHKYLPQWQRWLLSDYRLWFRECNVQTYLSWSWYRNWDTSWTSNESVLDPLQKKEIFLCSETDLWTFVPTYRYRHLQKLTVQNITVD